MTGQDLLNEIADRYPAHFEIRDQFLLVFVATVNDCSELQEYYSDQLLEWFDRFRLYVIERDLFTFYDSGHMSEVETALYLAILERKWRRRL